MPIAKVINHEKHGQLVLHIIDSVDFVLVGDSPIWRGHYRSFADPDAMLNPDARHQDSGRISSIGITELGTNPVAAFELAAIESERSPFFGGTIVSFEDIQQDALALYRARQWELIKYQRDSALIAGVNTPYGKFNTDTISLVNMLGAVAVGESQGPSWSTPWITFDNASTVLTVAQLKHIGLLVANWRGACYTWGNKLRVDLHDAQTKTAIQSVVWSNPSL